MPPPLRWRPLLGIGAFALAVRLLLSTVYWGHEEEDWSNLAALVASWQAPLDNVETEHMPLFAATAALVYGLIGDARIAALGLATFSGAAAVVALGWVGWRVFSPFVGLAAAFLLSLQPESALYSATALREGPYALLTILGAGAVATGHGRAAGIALGLAFLTRFNTMFTLVPALGIAAFLAGGTPQGRAARRALPIVVLTLFSWAAVYRSREGTWAFWEAVVARNTTDLRDYPMAERLSEGIDALVAVAVHVLPSHLGPALLPLSVLGLGLHLRPRRGLPAAWLALAALGTVGFFALIVFVTAYDWGHNLYWKHLASVAPWVCLFGARGAEAVLARLSGTPARVAFVGLRLGVTLSGWGLQARFQVERSDRWYGTQVRLARWVEGWLPPDHGLVADLIPASYLAQREGSPPTWGCADDELPTGDLATFGGWAKEHRVAFVFWFAESWVGCQDRLPQLAERHPWPAGPVTLVPVAWEGEYGIAGWRVVGLPGVPDPGPPPPDAGALPASGASTYPAPP